MKKWFLIFSLAVVAGALYFFLAAKPPVTKVITVKANIETANRCFLDTTRWSKWWPRQYAYRITGVYYNEVRFLLQDRDQGELPISLRIVQINQDSVLLAWDANVRRGAGMNLDTVLMAFRSFVEDYKNIYGVRFQRAMSKDSTLITLTSIATGYPGTEYIYRKIDSLNAYAANHGARVINFPMMNVTPVDSNHFKVMIALSLDKTLPGDGRIVIKRFIPWKMIEGEVLGGVTNVIRAMQQLIYYRGDQRLSIMALPFESLVTDRRQEPDSTKWVTKVCAPIS